ncbi:MAG: HAMP domain-containing sensor histidine kinase, partial [Acidimicrobiia bacterium]
MILGAVCALMTVAATVGAMVLQRRASAPVGEGVVFVNDSARAGDLIEGSSDPHDGVRAARNSLGIEAVSLVDSDGEIVASTSDPMIGSDVDNPLVMFGASEHRFAALAGAINEDLVLDGVVSWPAGSVLYQVVSPIAGTDQSVLLYYDVADLLSRRTPPGRIDPETIQLLGLAAIFGILSIVVFVGHSRLTRRYRTVQLESELLRQHSAELEATNAELDAARDQAEKALALAEEKIRIRSEFVLMINHELRTPLTSVVTGAQLLQATDLTESERDSLLDSMIKESGRLLEIIDQILAVARIENRGLSYQLDQVSLEAACRSVFNAHPSATSEATEHDHDGIAVRTDTKALGLVVASLVDNALTHGAENVSVGCSRDPIPIADLEVGERPASAVYITVTDDGPGIDREFLPRIFEKFEKSSFSSGTGLGLYMAKMIVDAL